MKVDPKILKKLRLAADHLTDDGYMTDASQKMRRLILQACNAAEFGEAYSTQIFARLFDQAITECPSPK